jgi:hypothetical protein
LKLKSLIKKNKQLRIKRQVVPFDQIKTVLMVWDSAQSRTDIEELKTFGHELRKKGKEITFLTFHAIKKFPNDMQANDLYKLICKGDFNLFASPKSKILKDLLNFPYDLLINGCLSDNEFLKSVVVYSKAGFRIGPYNSNDDIPFYEILIKPNGADPCENYLIETGKYLQKIK